MVNRITEACHHRRRCELQAEKAGLMIAHSGGWGFFAFIGIFIAFVVVARALAPLIRSIGLVVGLLGTVVGLIAGAAGFCAVIFVGLAGWAGWNKRSAQLDASSHAVPLSAIVALAAAFGGGLIVFVVLACRRKKQD